MRSTICAVAGALLVCACGGGDGNGTSSIEAPSVEADLPSGPIVVFSPSSIECKFPQGQEARVQGSISWANMPQNFDYGFVYNDIFRPYGGYKLVAGSVHRLMSINPSLPVGRYKGQLEWRVCLDGIQTCAQPVEGSPWLLPYDIEVVASTTQTNSSDCPTDPRW